MTDFHRSSQLWRRRIFLVLSITFMATCMILVLYVGFLCMNWNYPFRTTGSYDAFAAGSPFVGSSISVAPDGSRLVYASPNTGDGDIYTCSCSGLAGIQLTSNTA